MENVRTRLKGFGLFAIGLVLLVGGGIWEGRSALRTLREDRIWKTGKAAANVTVSGKERRRGPWRSYEATVSYDDDRRVHHRESYSLSSFWTLAHIFATPSVKYDPADPGAFATSWGQQLGWGRWVNHGLSLAFFILFGLVSTLVGWGEMRGGAPGAAPGR
jgi:hypothetical protein